MRTVFTYTCVVLLLMLITVDSSPKKPRNKPKNAGPKVVSVAENDVRKNPPKKEAAKRQIKKSHHYVGKIFDFNCTTLVMPSRFYDLKTKFFCRKPKDLVGTLDNKT